MIKTKFWLAQILMISVVSLILGASAFAKAPGHSKGIDMKNSHASDQAKEKANSNAGFENVVEEPGEEPDTSDDTGSDTTGVDPVAAAQATCTELYGAAADFNATSFTCTNLDTFESVQL